MTGRGIKLFLFHSPFMQMFSCSFKKWNKQRKPERVHYKNTCLSVDCCLFLLPPISYENVLLIAAVINSNEFNCSNAHHNANLIESKATAKYGVHPAWLLFIACVYLSAAVITCGFHHNFRYTILITKQRSGFFLKARGGFGLIYSRVSSQIINGSKTLYSQII